MLCEIFKSMGMKNKLGICYVNSFGARRVILYRFYKINFIDCFYRYLFIIYCYIFLRNFSRFIMKNMYFVRCLIV